MCVGMTKVLSLHTPAITAPNNNEIHDFYGSLNTCKSRDILGCRKRRAWKGDGDDGVKEEEEEEKEDQEENSLQCQQTLPVAEQMMLVSEPKCVHTMYYHSAGPTWRIQGHSHSTIQI